jgi:hypothetical protein
LKYVGTSEGSYKILDGGLDELISIYPSLAVEGDLVHFALEGDILWYQQIPTTATSLTLIYYAVPDTLTDGSDIPTDIPEVLHRDLIVNKSCEILFDLIEDGVNVQKVNTLECRGKYEVAVGKLQSWVSKRRGSVGRSFWRV